MLTRSDCANVIYVYGGFGQAPVITWLLAFNANRIPQLSYKAIAEFRKIILKRFTLGLLRNIPISDLTGLHRLIMP